MSDVPVLEEDFESSFRGAPCPWGVVVKDILMTNMDKVYKRFPTLEEQVVKHIEKDRKRGKTKAMLRKSCGLDSPEKMESLSRILDKLVLEKRIEAIPVSVKGKVNSTIFYKSLRTDPFYREDEEEEEED
jgi:hypothetical protein